MEARSLMAMAALSCSPSFLSPSSSPTPASSPLQTSRAVSSSFHALFSIQRKQLSQLTFNRRRAPLAASIKAPCTARFSQSDSANSGYESSGYGSGKDSSGGNDAYNASSGYESSGYGSGSDSYSNRRGPPSSPQTTPPLPTPTPPPMPSPSFNTSSPPPPSYAPSGPSSQGPYQGPPPPLPPPPPQPFQGGPSSQPPPPPQQPYQGSFMSPPPPLPPPPPYQGAFRPPHPSQPYQGGFSSQTPPPPPSQPYQGGFSPSQPYQGGFNRPPPTPQPYQGGFSAQPYQGGYSGPGSPPPPFQGGPNSPPPPYQQPYPPPFQNSPPPPSPSFGGGFNSQSSPSQPYESGFGNQPRPAQPYNTGFGSPMQPYGAPPPPQGYEASGPSPAFNMAPYGSEPHYPLPQEPRKTFAEIVKSSGKEQPVMLRFVWLEKCLGLGLDNVVPGYGAFPMTAYYFFPQKDAVAELKKIMESQGWISQKRSSTLLNQAEELIKLWQRTSGSPQEVPA